MNLRAFLLHLIVMAAVTPLELARVLRRHERRRAFPYVLLAALMIFGGLATWVLGGTAFLVGVLAYGGVAVAYVGQYLNDILRGRTVDPMTGAASVSAEGEVEICAGKHTTRFALADVVAARAFMSMSFDDLKGLADVLELELHGGCTLRIPDTFVGYAALGRAIPGVEWIDVDLPRAKRSALPTATVRR